MILLSLILDWEIVDCLMNKQDKQYESLLACNDYIVERED